MKNESEDEVMFKKYKNYLRIVLFVMEVYV